MVVDAARFAAFQRLSALSAVDEFPRVLKRASGADFFDLCAAPATKFHPGRIVEIALGAFHRFRSRRGADRLGTGDSPLDAVLAVRVSLDGVATCKKGLVKDFLFLMIREGSVKEILLRIVSGGPSF
jgi:hypothetical protein